MLQKRIIPCLILHDEKCIHIKNFNENSKRYVGDPINIINIFNDYLAPDLMRNLNIPVNMIWGEDDPWESVIEAKKWFHSISCIKSLKIISKAGHCPHDEAPDQVNPVLQRLIQQAT